MMTLTELLYTTKQLSHLDKIKLIRLLAEDIESREEITWNSRLSLNLCKK